MSVLLMGMEMPKEGFVEILVRDDGTVQQTGQSYRIDGTDYYTPYVGEMPVMYKAVPVPAHGDLTDRKAAYDSLLDGMVMTGYQSRALDCINEFYVPTIIPKEEGET